MNMKILATAVFLALLAIVHSTDVHSTKGPERTLEEHLPMNLTTCLVSLQKDNCHKCSGALIHRDYVLIGTNCEVIIFTGPGHIDVIVGIYDSRFTVHRTVKNKIKVPECVDISVVHLNELAAPTVNIPVPIISSANIRSVTEGTTLGWYENHGRMALKYPIIVEKYLYAPMSLILVPQHANEMGTLLFHEGDLLAIGTGGVENNRLIFARLDKKSRYIFSAVARYITATFQAS